MNPNHSFPRMKKLMLVRESLILWTFLLFAGTGRGVLQSLDSSTLPRGCPQSRAPDASASRINRSSIDATSNSRGKGLPDAGESLRRMRLNATL
ncbi:hypothetical protein U1Q18_044745 [Sarracenia purpurea var. burkii]